MRKDKVVQVLVTEAEQALLAEAAHRSNTSLSRKGRELLLAWGSEAVDAPGGVRGGRCGSSSGCLSGNARWWNANAKIFCCEKCAIERNEKNPSVCVLDGGPDRLPNAVVIELRAATVTRESLVEEVARAARALSEFDERKSGKGAS
jgi:hypothetical protein